MEEGATQDTPQTVSWTASEYIAHHKSTKWYVLLGIATLIVASLLWLLNRDIVSPMVAVMGAAVIAIYGSKPPRALHYELDSQGLIVEDKQLLFHDYRSFSVATQGAFSMIILMPLHRFVMPSEIYYAPEDEATIVAIISKQLPLEQHRRDLIDRLMHRIHF